MGLKPGKVESLNGKPFFIQKGPVGCLLIHGFTCTPMEMSLLGNYLAEREVTVSGVLLAGHGTVPSDMNKTRWADWAASAENALLELKEKCSEVFIAGQSLGGAITLYLAARHEIAGAASLSAAVMIEDWKLSLLPFIRPFTSYFPKGGNTSFRMADAEALCSCYAYNPLDCVTSLIEFTGVVRESVKKIKCPLTIIHSMKDEMLKPKNAQYIYDNAPAEKKELVWLKESCHGVQLDVERDVVFEKVFGLMERESKLLK